MLLVIDNYDSFTYNLVQYLGELKADLQVHRNDQITLEQVRAKERALARLDRDDTELTRWKRVADMWCSGWFRDPSSSASRPSSAS